MERRERSEEMELGPILMVWRGDESGGVRGGSVEGVGEMEGDKGAEGTESGVSQDGV